MEGMLAYVCWWLHATVAANQVRAREQRTCDTRLSTILSNLMSLYDWEMSLALAYEVRCYA